MRGMRIATALLGLCLVIGPACKKDKGGSGTTEGSGSATGSGSSAGSDTGSAGSDTMAGSGSAGSDSGSATGSGTGSGSASDQMTKRGGNCPSTVSGSTTNAELKDGKVL